MRIHRLTLTLPARLKDTAHHDARRIAEALAQELHARDSAPDKIQISGQGQTGAVLAQRVALALPKGGHNGR
ncbi:hypothetical protein I5535_10750 [Rhodobacteraceae bacterium F11138]|nr:hypothetical protein [Rhodobacteraceae bacterium F11138]